MKDRHVRFGFTSDFWIRTTARAYDLARRSRIVRELRAAVAVAVWLLSFLPQQVRLFSFANALYLTSLTRLPAFRRMIYKYVTVGSSPRCERWISQRIGWDRYSEELAREAIPKTLILKQPLGESEKGVIYIAFECNFLNLLQRCDWQRLVRRYFVIVASSCSPPDYNTLFAMIAVGRHGPVFAGVSNDDDFVEYAALRPFVEPLPLLASDWISSGFYQPVEPAYRSIDIAMVAGWARGKNHWLLFQALQELPSNLRVVLIGQDMSGRSADDVYNEARAFRVEDRIEIVRDAPPATVAETLCDSRCSVVLSRREGSSVIVTESLFADTPVVMLEGAHIGSMKYINEATGRFTTPRHLAATIIDVLQDREHFAPRLWASQHTGADMAAQRLNAFLRSYSKVHALPWTEDTRPMCRRPDPIYLHGPDNRIMQEAYDQAYIDYGLLVRHHLAHVGR